MQKLDFNFWAYTGYDDVDKILRNAWQMVNCKIEDHRLIIGDNGLTYNNLSNSKS